MVCHIGSAPPHPINYNDFGWESWEMGWTARSILLGHGFSSPFQPLTGPTALVPPLYPYILAAIFRLFGFSTLKVIFAVLGLNSLCSALTCIPIYFLARKTLNLRAARIAAVAWALYPFSIYFSACRVWDYALTVLLISCCLLAAEWLPSFRVWGWTGFGLLYGVAILSNPSVVSLLPIFLGCAIWRVRRMRGPWLTKGLAACLGIVCVCLPWTVRNERVMHGNFFIRDGFWLEFYAGNNGDPSETNSSWAHPASNPVQMKMYESEGEMAYMAEKRSLALTFVKHHPTFFAIATARRVMRFWTGFWSLNPRYLQYEPLDLPNIPFCLFLLLFMVRGLHQWWRRDKRAVLPYLLAICVFPLPYYLTHSSMDYREPLEPVIVLLVTIGLFGIESRPHRQSLRASSRIERVFAAD